jgi:hypothetical protein
MVKTDSGRLNAYQSALLLVLLARDNLKRSVAGGDLRAKLVDLRLDAAEKALRGEVSTKELESMIAA